MNEKDLRIMVIDLLDDENGINETAFNSLETFCKEHGWADILNLVVKADSLVDENEKRHWLDEDDANDLRDATFA